MSARSKGQGKPPVGATKRVWGIVAVLALAALVVGLRSASRDRTPTGPAGTMPAVGAPALDGSFTTVGQHTRTIATLRGRPALVWFVATWCSSCQAGTEALARNIDRFSSAGVRVVEVELYNDLGEPGPNIRTFGQQFAGPAFANPDWTWGTASKGLSFAYDPKGYLDIYYLLDAHGRIRYINGSPSGTMPQLLKAVGELRS